MFVSLGAGSKINQQRRSQLPEHCEPRAELRPPPIPTPEATEEWFVCTLCMSTGHVMFAPFVLLPFISNIPCNFDSTVPCLVSVTPLYFCTRLSYTVRIFYVMFLGDAYSWATRTPGDAFFLGDAHAWRRLLSWRRVCLAMLVATSSGKKIKTETEARFFSNFFFFLFG